MTSPHHGLNTAVALEPGPETCVVVSRGGRRTVGYAAPFEVVAFYAEHGLWDRLRT